MSFPATGILDIFATDPKSIFDSVEFLMFVADRRKFLRDTALASSAFLLPSMNRSNWGFAQETEFPKQVGKLTAYETLPMNAEPALADLVQSWMTPNDLFYIRSHGGVPKVDGKNFRLIVDGMVRQKLELSLEELSQFAKKEIVVTMTCAGNRRYEHSKISPIKGVPWHEGAIGNAKWGGVLLSAVLKKAGVLPEASHVWFDGLDEVSHGDGIIPFGASIPLRKAMDDTPTMPGALLCTKMNGRDLEPDHGFPLRTIVPGYIGARSVKWLGRITVSDRPTANHFVSTAYKLVQEGSDLEWDEQGPIYRYPINSAICTPAADSKLKVGKATVAGYALPPGEAGRTIRAVMLSADGGKTWLRAQISSPVNEYCWVLWKADVDVTSKTEEIIVRAVDSENTRQPPRANWNLKGYMYNAWHRMPVTIES